MAKVKEDVQIASLRSLDDFLMESARFQIPNFKDGEKWGNRVFNNLLYYQTNYFLTALIVFLVVGLIHPVKMFYGFLALAVAFGMFYYITYDRRPTAHKFKRDHPLISIVVVLSGCYFIVYMLGSVVVFITGILLPVIVVFIHASMRQRNIKNKIANKMEHIGLQRTPMGIFLESLGQEQEMSLKNCSRSLDTWSSIVKNFWHQIRVIGNKYKQKLFDLFKDKKAKAK